MISKIRSAGVAAVAGIAIISGLGIAGPATANAQSSSPAGTLDCGLSSGLVHWAYTNCGNSASLVRINHIPHKDPNWSETRCIGAGKVETVGLIAYETVTVNELQGPCIPR